MARSKQNPKVDTFLRKTHAWQDAIAALRALALESGLTEELKWGKPCYTFQGANVLIVIPLKASCALMFTKGALLKDRARLLTKPGVSTQAGRWIKFGSAAEIAAQTEILKTYIQEAMEAEKAGRKVEFKKNPEPVPVELQHQLNRNSAVRRAFAALTPGRQRGYILYISGAKQSQTRESRVEKCLPRILGGKGLND